MKRENPWARNGRERLLPTDRDWAIVTHFAMHGSFRETSRVFGMPQTCVKRRVERIAPQLLAFYSGCVCWRVMRHVTFDFWRARRERIAPEPVRAMVPL